MSLYLSDPDVTLYCGDALAALHELPSESVHCIATSPPFYALRDYGTGRWEGGDPECSHRRSATGGNPKQGANKGNNNEEAAPFRDVCGLCGATRIDQQIGLESTPEEWAQKLVEVFREARRVLRKDGTLWVECGDSYAATATSDRRMLQPTGLDGTPATTRQPQMIARRTALGAVKPKDLLGTPWLLAFALRADGWWLRGCNIWAKPNAMPESAKDRCTTAHSYVFQLSRSARYFFAGDAISEPAVWERWGDQTVPKHEGTKTAAGWIPAKTKNELAAEFDHRRAGLVGQKWKDTGRRTNGRRERTEDMRGFDNRLERADGFKHPRSVWTIPTQGFPEAHFATWPEALARRIILAACPEDGVVLDPFAGSGTTLLVARKLGRRGIGIDLNPEYLNMAARRLSQQSLFAKVPSDV